MTSVNIQDAIAEYHHEMHMHMGMDMHDFHWQWHFDNRTPRRPNRPVGVTWAVDNDFGSKFLQMHHEMVRAEDSEPRPMMGHQSLVSWFKSKNYYLPKEWDPLTPIPPELDFRTDNPNHQRITNDPQFKLPDYFTVDGIGSNQAPEPITYATKLADFVNLNQLGCCIVYEHNLWHAAIGGALMNMRFAIDDPIFYFGIHWHIDKVYEAYQSLLIPPDIKPRPVPEQFTAEQDARLKHAEELGDKMLGYAKHDH